MTVCARCREKAIFQTLKGPLCRKHFSEWYERGVVATVEKYGMISPRERICVGFSGGKDSTVLLAVLAKRNFDAELIAVTVDEGIRGYRDDTIEAAKITAKNLDVELHIISFRDVAGGTLDELLAPAPNRACSVCGTLRRHALNTVARKLDVDKIATGHCLDDEAQSVVMNYLRGDITRITSSFNSNSAGLFIPRIKPLFRSTERATVSYGLANRLLTPLPECSYTRFALRKDVRTFLGKCEHSTPGTLLRIVEGQERLTAMLPKPNGMLINLHPCENCGEPTANRLCAACQHLEFLLH
ncbi:MAG TPA: TIGR00269 family protein [Methanocorpusculum sp.]|nr:TIGR00269 family protein [Methanocorpusculum sp.]